MPMTFDTADRPADDIMTDLSNRDTNLKKVPLPKNVEQPHSNFEELIASQRYKQIVNNLSRYTGLSTGTGENNFHQIMNQMMGAQRTIAQIEHRHLAELERIAVELVMQQMGIEEGDIEFDAKIIQRQLENDGFTGSPSDEEEPEEVEVEKELFDELESLNLERAKRRLINAIMQGAAEKGHYMYHMVADKLREVTGSDQLLGLYGILISTADTMYWQMSNNSLPMITGGGSGEPNAGGKESVDLDSDPPKVIARAINFPILVHELIKGTIEVIAGLYGQPSDINVAGQVRDLEDTVDKEIWDLRLGPVIWEKIRAEFPEDVLTNEDKVGMQSIYLQHLFKKPAKEFLVFVKEVLSGSPAGKRLMVELNGAIAQMLNDFDYNEAIDNFDKDLTQISDNTDDDDLDDLLRGLGIHKSDDDTE